MVDWLEKSAVTELLKYPHKTDYMTDSVGWENTQHSLERGRLTQQLVSQMVSVHKHLMIFTHCVGP